MHHLVFPEQEVRSDGGRQASLRVGAQDRGVVGARTRGDGRLDASCGDDRPRSSFEELWSAFRALVNTREPIPAAPEFLAVQDELLQGLIAEAGITRVEDVASCSADARVGLWRGDITTIAADAIVNAANSAMTGCWQPLHSCIDNAIHTFASVHRRAAAP